MNLTYAIRLPRVALGMITLISGAAAHAAVTYSFNSADTWNTADTVFRTTTLDPVATPPTNTAVVIGGNTLRAAQTFQVTGTGYTVTDLYIATDDYAANATVNFRLYSIADAVTSTATGYYPTPIEVLWSGSFSQASANSLNQTFRIQLTGADQFTLAANTGNAGYAFEVFTEGTTQVIDWSREASSVSSTYMAYRQPLTGDPVRVDNTRNLYFAFDGVAIPEPSTYAALLGVVALGLCALRRRR